MKCMRKSSSIISIENKILLLQLITIDQLCRGSTQDIQRVDQEDQERSHQLQELQQEVPREMEGELR